MNIWICSMECAGIIEAGGVKNVTFSLCKEFAALGHEVTLFIPVFKTNSWDYISDLKKDFIKNVVIKHCGKEETISYSKAVFKDEKFNIIFINHPAFEEKEAVYTYTANEQKKNPEFVKGMGHKDTLFLDSLYSKAVATYGEYAAKEELPDIMHCQDASTALVPVYIRFMAEFHKTVSVITIHNAGPAYHHNYSSIGEAAWFTDLSEVILSGALNGTKVEPYLLASNAGAFITTVSENYAMELKDPFNKDETEGLAPIFFSRSTKITGITNGIDFERYDPSDVKVSNLPYAFNPETGDLEGKYKCREYFFEEILKNKEYECELPVYGEIECTDYKKNIFIVYHGRITTQKGLSVLIESIPVILNNFDNVYFLIAGQGEISLEEQLKVLCTAQKGRVVFINGYEKSLARLTNAVGDFIVLPSFFEPCGLEDFISQIYGTLPVAHKTGGLNKILNNQTGFLYKKNTSASLTAKLSEVITIKKYCPEKIDQIISFASKYVRENYLWSKVISDKYIPFFNEILKKNDKSY